MTYVQVTRDKWEGEARVLKSATELDPITVVMMMNGPKTGKVGGFFATDIQSLPECPRCEENPLVEGNYLCEECRFG